MSLFEVLVHVELTGNPTVTVEADAPSRAQQLAEDRIRRCLEDGALGQAVRISTSVWGIHNVDSTESVKALRQERDELLESCTGAPRHDAVILSRVEQIERELTELGHPAYEAWRSPAAPTLAD